MNYNHANIEPKWQKIWNKKKIFNVTQNISKLINTPKYYILDMFPYPSADGLHIGHPEGYSASDTIARMKRLQGYNVMHPIGWDGFGLPTERAAINKNNHPAKITKQNINNFKHQLKRLGFSYDWSREINTTDPNYYKWTQWMFLQLYKKGLAYLDNVPVNWCSSLGTVLSNEEVKNGVYIETGDKVEQRIMKQWMIKITNYAERLINDLDELDWPTGIKEMQRNWIGKSTGVTINFLLEKLNTTLNIFTNQPETIFGITYCLISTKHKLLNKIITKKQKNEVNKYIKSNKMQINTNYYKDNTGVFSGSFAFHPITKLKVPIWISNYITNDYETGVTIGVPGNNKRDYEFAKKFKIPIIQIIDKVNNVIHQQKTGEEKLINSKFLNNLNILQANNKIVSYLENNKHGKRTIKYKLKDWLFSRQRYWGEPFPIIHLTDGTIRTIKTKDLPVKLPIINNYKPIFNSTTPLSKANKNWIKIKYDDGKIGYRELNTMPQWAGSCWYYLRYLDPKNNKEPFSKKLETYWMPVDLYIGGAEHAVSHLLYTRFLHKVLYDCELVSTKEPFKKLFNQGMILSNSYKDNTGKYYKSNDVEQRNKRFFTKKTGLTIITKIEKMSKSKLNVINPDDIIEKYGADALRLYELFMGPLEQVKIWKIKGISGMYRFLKRVWKLIINERNNTLSTKINNDVGEKDKFMWSLLQKTIKKVTNDTECLHFNTAISQMMIFVNEAIMKEQISKQTINIFLKLLLPYAPHISEELWQRLGNKEILSLDNWPKYDNKYCIDNITTLVIQINGKKIDTIKINKKFIESEIKSLILQKDTVKKIINKNKIKNIIFVPNKVINIVTKLEFSKQ